VSVGHLARLVEAGGIPTVVIGIRAFRNRLAAMRLPRTIITPHPLGRTLGAPGDHETQTRVIKAAFELLENAKTPGLIVDLPGKYHVLMKGLRT
jgi:hypothetical protein